MPLAFGDEELNQWLDTERVVPPAKVTAPSQAIPIVHDSPEWHALRAKHIGGSEVAALFDLPSEQRPGYMVTRFALWHIKSGRIASPIVDNPRAKWGLRLEEVIADAATEENSWTVARGGYVSDVTTQGLGCTLDYVIASDPSEEGSGALECKNVDWLVAKRSWTEDEPPPHILLQHQHQLAATGYSWGAVAALVGGNDLRVYRYKARPKVIAEIRRRVLEFWASIESGDEPDIDGADSSSAAVAALYPELADDAVDLSDNEQWTAAAASFAAASADRKEANARYEDARNHVAYLLGSHRRAYGNGWEASCSVTKENLGRLAKPGELIGKRAESRRYSVKEVVL